MKRSDIWKLIKSYRWKSMFFRYLVLELVGFVLPISILLTVLQETNTKAKDRIVDSLVVQSFQKTSQSFEKIADEINAQYLLFSGKTYTEIFLLKDRVEKVDVTRLAEMMSDYMATADYVDSVYLYSSASDYVLSTYSTNYKSVFYNTTWYEEYEKEKNNFFVFPVTIGKSKDLISFVYTMGYTKDDEPNGLFVVNVDVRKLEKYIDIYNSKEQGENYCLMDEDGDVIYTSMQITADSVGETEWLKRMEEDLEIGTVSVVQSKENVTCGTRLNLGLSLISVVDISYFSDVEFFDKDTFAILITFSIVAAILLSVYSSFKSYKSIIEIISKLELISNGVGQKDNEVDSIIFGIMSVLEDKKHMETELVEKIMALRNAQIVALQTQINPHFIFNTLNLVSVIVMRMTKGDNDVSKIIRLLSYILRVSLNTKEYVVSVKEEIEYAKTYLEIESIKRKNSFDVVWDIEEGVLVHRTVKFVLQPILENSIEHGVKNLRDRRGKIEIIIKCVDGQLIYRIRDNGKGMSEDLLEVIRQTLKTDEILRDRHIGMLNVHQRIRILCGEEYGIQVRSGEDWSEVCIYQPLNMT